MASPEILIIGASASGLAVAEGLRRNALACDIHIVGAEQHPPYDRPPLSKKVLSGEWTPQRTALRTPEDLLSLGIEWSLGSTATRLDRDRRLVTLDDGSEVGFDILVIATGASPRHIAGWESIEGVHTVHSLVDSVALRDELQTAQKVVVIGAGVLGCEVASTAHRLGREVTIVDIANVPMQRLLGDELGTMVADLHTSAGIDLVLDAAILGPVVENSRVVGVDVVGAAVGERRLDADLVVVAIGSVPATGWLHDSGLTIADGVVCDSRCRADDDIFAVGDVARWMNDDVGVTVRLENRTNATEQALFVADILSGADKPYLPVPYFWTDQLGIKIQVYGEIPAASSLKIIDGSPDAGRFMAVADVGEEVCGAIAWNNPRGAIKAHEHVVAARMMLPGPAG